MVFRTNTSSRGTRVTSILHTAEADMVLVFVIGLVLRLVNLQNFPRWYVDEGSMAEQGINMFHLHYGYKTWGPNFFPPLFVMVDGLFLTLLGQDYVIARLPGVLMGSISCVMTCIIARDLSSRRVGLVAAGILAISGAYINRLALQDNATELFFMTTILVYMKFKENPGNRLGILLGLSSGLAVLSKYTGVVAPLFLLMQGGIDKRLSQMKMVFALVLVSSLVYPILGLALDWKGFIQDTLFQASREFSPGITLYVVSIGWPVTQLELWNAGLGLASLSFTTLGLVCTVYMMARQRVTRNHMMGTVFLSLLVVLLVAGHVWWASLIMVYPLYAIATSFTLFDVVSKIRSNRSRLPVADSGARKILALDPALVSLLLLAALFVASLYSLFVPQPAGARAVLLVLCAAMVLTVGAYRAGFRHVLRIAVVAVILVLIVGAAVDTSVQLGTNETRDQVAVVNYLNAHAAETDMVAANPAITWLLKCVGVNYAEVALYTTHKNTFLYGAELLPRFRMNISLWNVRYIVLDTPWVRDKIGGSESVQELTPIILSTWRNVANIGDYHVYENPQRAVGVVLYAVHGYVLAPDGITPVPGCWVSVYDPTVDVTSGSWTDIRGYYSFSTIAGTYIFDVWPPSTLPNYAHYQEAAFIVLVDVAKNITLTYRT